MIDFRYHLVSIIAVFLALAVGLVVGSTALSGKALTALTAAQHKAISDNTALRKEKNQLQQELAGDQAFAAASAERLLTGLLTGERVVLVAAPNADSAELTGLSTALRQAGATVTGQVALTGQFMTTTGQNEATLNQLAQRLAGTAGLVVSPQPSSPLSGQQAAAQVLAASLVSGSDSLTSTASQDILAGFSQGNFVTVTGAPADAPAELAVLVTPSGTPQQSASQVLVAVAQALKAAGSATVMAGAVSSIGPGSAINAEVSAGNVVSTVDNADTEIGQITVVQALRFLLNGKPPAAWGAVPAAAPSPAPTPVATPTIRPSASSSPKSHA